MPIDRAAPARQRCTAGFRNADEGQLADRGDERARAIFEQALTVVKRVSQAARFSRF
jgi:hypothetical protein